MGEKPQKLLLSFCFTLLIPYIIGVLVFVFDFLIPFIVYLFLALFLSVHFYYWKKKKIVPYVFPYSNLWQDVLIRGALPLFVIFAPVGAGGGAGSVLYAIIIICISFFVLQRVYQKGFFYTPEGFLRYPGLFGKVEKFLCSANGSTTVLYNERAIFALSFLLPFQPFIPFDIQRISIFLFSFNCFGVLLMIPATRETVGRIFRRLSRALVIFTALAGFILVLSVQLKNLYFLQYSAYFSDLSTSLKTIAMIISGEFFEVVSNGDKELFLLVFLIYSFVGIVLLSFFTAFLVDADKSYKTSWIIGRINHKDVYLELLFDSQTGRQTPVAVIYDSKKYDCSDEDVSWYNSFWQHREHNIKMGKELVTDAQEGQYYTVIDAFALICKTETISKEEYNEIDRKKELAVLSRKKEELDFLRLNKNEKAKPDSAEKIKILKKQISIIDGRIKKLDSWWNSSFVRDCLDDIKDAPC